MCPHKRRTRWLQSSKPKDRCNWVWESAQAGRARARPASQESTTGGSACSTLLGFDSVSSLIISLSPHRPTYAHLFSLSLLFVSLSFCHPFSHIFCHLSLIIVCSVSFFQFGLRPLVHPLAAGPPLTEGPLLSPQPPAHLLVLREGNLHKGVTVSLSVCVCGRM